MTIYGVALLAFCFLLGKILGNLFGDLLGFNGDIGGVGFAMIFLILGHQYLKKKEWIKAPSTNGVLFWSSMYLPVIVAMAATQNVHAALSGGWVAVLAGGLATIAGFFLVPMIAKIGAQPSDDQPFNEVS